MMVVHATASKAVQLAHAVLARFGLSARTPIAAVRHPAPTTPTSRRR
ncbi:MAG: hypothetical protein N2039_04135 [Gemmataceae bacterium]|nr:hypothetical protein [Gemmataceae bacterium]